MRFEERELVKHTAAEFQQQCRDAGFKLKSMRAFVAGVMPERGWVLKRNTGDIGGISAIAKHSNSTYPVLCPDPAEALALLGGRELAESLAGILEKEI